ncbi:hypothetical protein AAC387_Pa08g0975 [Persea americana]
MTKPWNPAQPIIPWYWLQSSLYLLALSANCDLRSPGSPLSSHLSTLSCTLRSQLSLSALSSCLSALSDLSALRSRLASLLSDLSALSSQISPSRLSALPLCSLLRSQLSPSALSSLLCALSAINDRIYHGIQHNQ